MKKKTRQDILDDWDEYKCDNIDENRDWTKEHDEYLSKEFVAVDEILEKLRDYQAGCSPTVVMDIIEELSH